MQSNNNSTETVKDSEADDRWCVVIGDFEELLLDVPGRPLLVPEYEARKYAGVEHGTALPWDVAVAEFRRRKQFRAKGGDPDKVLISRPNDAWTDILHLMFISTLPGEIIARFIAKMADGGEPVAP